MKEKLLREGAIMDSLDDADVSGSGGAGGPAAMDHGEVGGESGPAYSTTSSQQTYSLTTLPHPVNSTHAGHVTHPHQITVSVSDGDVGLSPQMTTLDRYSV